MILNVMIKEKRSYSNCCTVANITEVSMQRASLQTTEGARLSELKNMLYSFTTVCLWSVIFAKSGLRIYVVIWMDVGQRYGIDNY